MPHRTNTHRLYDSYSLNVFGSILEALGLFDASLIATVQPDVVMVNAAMRGYGAKLGSLGGDRPYYGLNGDTLRIWSGKHELEEFMGFLNGQFPGFHHQKLGIAPIKTWKLQYDHVLMDGVRNWNCVSQHLGIQQDMVMKWIVSPIYTYMGQEPELFELAIHF